MKGLKIKTPQELDAEPKTINIDVANVLQCIIEKTYDSYKGQAIVTDDDFATECAKQGIQITEQNYPSIEMIRQTWEPHGWTVKQYLSNFMEFGWTFIKKC